MDLMLEKQRTRETKASCPYLLEYLPLILFGNFPSFRHSLDYRIAPSCDRFNAHV